MAVKIPEHWSENTWEEKARENPLFAVMTTEDVADAGADNFDPKHLEPFLAKGRRVYDENIAPLLAARAEPRASLVVGEYGCGVGRILRAVHEEGYRTFGIDISETMLKHCATIAPGVTDLYLLDENGVSPSPSAHADLLFSFAVVKHIATLTNWIRALDEMVRALKPGGTLALNVNTEDFQHGDLETPRRTLNTEHYSLHFRPGKSRPRRHDQSNWSGVYIGHQTLVDLFAERLLRIERYYYQDKVKLRGIWYIATKLEEPAPKPAAPPGPDAESTPPPAATAGEASSSTESPGA